MKTFSLLLASSLLLFACGPKSEQSGSVDSLSAPDTSSSVAGANAGADAGAKLADFEVRIDDSTSVRVLQWEEISMSEYGPGYSFKDLKGEVVFLSVIDIPGFDFEKNEYFTAEYSTESVFPKVALKESTVGVWYKVTIQEQNREMNGAEGSFPIIIAIEPV